MTTMQTKSWHHATNLLASWQLVLVLQLSFLIVCGAQLSYNFYDGSCPNLPGIVRSTVQANLLRDPTAIAALVRLFFHDCIVQGCDASILLSTQAGGAIVSELGAPANLGIRRLDFIDAVKVAVERSCPGAVSCADLVVLAAREAVRVAGGPFIEVPLGRRDSTTASAARAAAELPPADTRFDGFLRLFSAQGMTLEEKVAFLGGGHSLGVGHCASVQFRLYPQKETGMSLVLYNLLRLRCPPRANVGGRVAAPNDLTFVLFDTQYFRTSLTGNGLFRVDSEVAQNALTAPIERSFLANPQAFSRAFSSAFVKLSLADVLTGSQGEIRRNCRLVN